MRSEIQQLVACIKPFDTIEEQHINFVNSWIASGAPLFRTQKPAIPNTHLVAYFVVVNPEMDQVLLVDHKKAGLWLPPGGHVELDEHPTETVRREIKEELGIEANFLRQDPLLLTVTPTVGSVAKHTDVTLWYLLQADPQQTMVFDTEEFHQIRWFAVDDVPHHQADPHMRRFLNKLQTSRVVRD